MAPKRSNPVEIEDPKRLEAKIRAAMWHHSQINPGRYDPKTTRGERVAARHEIHEEIDALYDRWATARLLLALEHLEAS